MEYIGERTELETKNTIKNTKNIYIFYNIIIKIIFFVKLKKKLIKIEATMKNEQAAAALPSQHDKNIQY